MLVIVNHQPYSLNIEWILGVATKILVMFATLQVSFWDARTSWCCCTWRVLPQPERWEVEGVRTQGDGSIKVQNVMPKTTFLGPWKISFLMAQTLWIWLFLQVRFATTCQSKWRELGVSGGPLWPVTSKNQLCTSLMFRLQVSHTRLLLEVMHNSRIIYFPIAIHLNF